LLWFIFILLAWQKKGKTGRLKKKNKKEGTQSGLGFEQCTERLLRVSVLALLAKMEKQ